MQLVQPEEVGRGCWRRGRGRGRDPEAGGEDAEDDGRGGRERESLCFGPLELVAERLCMPKSRAPISLPKRQRSKRRSQTVTHLRKLVLRVLRKPLERLEPQQARALKLVLRRLGSEPEPPPAIRLVRVLELARDPHFIKEVVVGLVDGGRECDVEGEEKLVLEGEESREVGAFRLVEQFLPRRVCQISPVAGA